MTRHGVLARVLAGFVVLGAVVIPAGRTGAVVAPPTPSVVAPPRVVDGSCKVLEDAWELDCRALSRRRACRARLTQQIIGPCAIERPAGWEIKLGDAQAPPIVGGGTLHLVPEGPQRLVLEGEFEVPSERRSTGWAWPACEVRHMWFHAGDRTRDYLLAVAPSPVERQAEGYLARVTLTPPTDLAWRGTETPTSGEGSGWSRVDGLWQTALGGPTDASRRTRASETARFEQAEALVHHGGPQLSLGAGLAGDATSFRVRAEHEFALDGWFLPGVAIDADTRSGFLVTPRIEFASPMLLVLPSVSLGIGLPISLASDPDVGVRLISSLHLGPVGIVMSHDWFPGSRRGDETSLLLRFSL